MVEVSDIAENVSLCNDINWALTTTISGLVDWPTLSEHSSHCYDIKWALTTTITGLVDWPSLSEHSERTGLRTFNPDSVHWIPDSP